MSGEILYAGTYQFWLKTVRMLQGYFRSGHACSALKSTARPQKSYIWQAGFG
jgi:hypothetical protein